MTSEFNHNLEKSLGVVNQNDTIFQKEKMMPLGLNILWLPNYILLLYVTKN
jgi:hypothetical protein